MSTNNNFENNIITKIEESEISINDNLNSKIKELNTKINNLDSKTSELKSNITKLNSDIIYNIKETDVRKKYIHGYWELFAFIIISMILMIICLFLILFYKNNPKE